MCALPEGHVGPHSVEGSTRAQPAPEWSGAVYVSKVSVHNLRNGYEIAEPETPYVLEAIGVHVVDTRPDQISPLKEPHLIVVWRPVRLR